MRIARHNCFCTGFLLSDKSFSCADDDGDADSDGDAYGDGEDKDRRVAK